MQQVFDELKAADWILLVYTVTTMAAVLVAVFTILHNRKMMAANWLFNAHRGFHGDDKLYHLFDQLKYKNYKFNCYPTKGKIDLQTEKEKELVNFLDFINSVNAAIARRMISRDDLRKTTIGFALEEVKTCDAILEYMEYTDEQDAKRDMALRAWGFLPRRGGAPQRSGRNRRW